MIDIFFCLQLNNKIIQISKITFPKARVEGSSADTSVHNPRSASKLSALVRIFDSFRISKGVLNPLYLCNAYSLHFVTPTHTSSLQRVTSLTTLDGEFSRPLGVVWNFVATMV